MTALPEFGDPDALYIIDLSGFVHRFWHVGPSFAARNFAGMLEKIVTSRGPARLVIAEDTVWPTFRHEMVTTYKANRKETQGGAERASKLEQLRLAGELAEDLYGVRRFGVRGFEADDVIATLATWGAEEGLRVVILALDKDMMQLVSTHTVMWDGKGAATGPAEVQEKFGVSPAQIVDYLAIVGDSTDNVAGIRGIGPKGAVELLKQFGRLDVALHVANAVGPETGSNHPFFDGRSKLWARLVASQAEADLARRLVKLRTDVPLPIDNLDALVLS